MTKNELDDVLRWGTEELFKDGEGGEGGEKERRGNEQEIVWDDEAVDALLDRSSREEEVVKEKNPKEHWSNEYLSSFKVLKVFF